MESIYVKAMALASGAMFAGNPGQYAVDDQRFQALTAGEVRNAANAWLRKPSYKLTVLPFGSHKVIADGADRTRLPPLGASPAFTLPQVREARLSNGIRVVLAERPGTPTVDMAMVFDAGQAAEQTVKRGVGGFTLGLMDEGTLSRTGQQFADRQALLGARIYSYSDVDTTAFMASAMTRSLSETVALWADYIRNPAFRPADLERDRQQHLSGLSQSLVDADQVAQRTFTNLIFGPGHAYGVPLSGRAETIKSITREDLIQFHGSWIRPDNAAIYAAGNTDLATLTATLERAFGDWRAPTVAKGSKTIGAVSEATAPRVVLIDKPGAIQSAIRVGQILPNGSDPRAFEIGAMNDVLGGNFTARLNMNLREDKGWTYGASSGIAEARGPQAFGVATSVQTDKTAEALSEIDKELRGIHGARPATQAELNLLGKGEVLSLPGRFETNNAMVGYLQYVNRFGRPYNWITTLPDAYAALKPETITDSAKLLQPDRMTWVVVGDLSRIEAKVRALKLGEVEVWDTKGHKLR
jgi:predicted Zn-dependent peptidase